MELEYWELYTGLVYVEVKAFTFSFYFFFFFKPLDNVKSATSCSVLYYLCICVMLYHLLMQLN